MKYQYPDKNDELTIQLISNEYDGEYWGKSEDAVLEEAFKMVDQLEEKYDEKIMLDLGCGKGRLIGAFAGFVDRMIAVEPDVNRFMEAAAEGLRVKAETGKDIQVINGDITAVNAERSFDLILSSHVMQHITRKMAADLVAGMSENLEEGGLLIMTTTHTSEDEDLFYKESWKDGSRLAEVITAEEFDQYFGVDGVLPVRIFSEKTITKMAEMAGLTVEKILCYHFKGHQNVSEDILANEKGDCTQARDVMYIFRKKPVLVDANIGYKFSFSIFDEDTGLRLDDEYELRARLKKQFKELVFYDEPESENEPVLVDLRRVEGFLHGSGLPFKCFRALIKDYSLKMDGCRIEESGVLMSIFPESDTAQLTISLSVKDTDVDRLVYMKQVQGNGAKLINKDGRLLSVKEVFEEVSGCLERKITDIEETYLIEVKKFGQENNVDQIISEHSKEIYGIMCGDEGYRHVPKNLADSRMENSWGSREFIRLVSFGSCSVFLNLHNSPAAEIYRENRKIYDNSYYGDMNPYFTMDSSFAGINHGVFFAVELTMVIKTICNRILRRQVSYYKGHKKRIKEDIRQTKNYRGELLTTLRRVENLTISEIGEMEKVVLISQQIYPIIEKLKYLLELLESELDLLYQTSTNKLANALALGGLIFAGVQIILGIMAL